jgi:hypothetical protein
MPTAHPAKPTLCLTLRERQLVEASRRLEPAPQQILWNALIRIAGGAPGARLVLAVDR